MHMQHKNTHILSSKSQQISIRFKIFPTQKNTTGIRHASSWKEQQYWRWGDFTDKNGLTRFWSQRYITTNNN